MAKNKRKQRKRECGDCQACCFSVAVRAMNKPKNTRCQHQCGIGCAIYESRPRECLLYKCSWLDGTFPRQGWRPDQNGILGESMFLPIDGGGEHKVIMVWEVAPGTGIDQETKWDLIDMVEPLLSVCWLEWVGPGPDDYKTQVHCANAEDEFRLNQVGTAMREGTLAMRDGDGVVEKLEMRD